MLQPSEVQQVAGGDSSRGSAGSNLESSSALVDGLDEIQSWSAEDKVKLTFTKGAFKTGGLYPSPSGVADFPPVLYKFSRATFFQVDERS